MLYAIAIPAVLLVLVVLHDLAQRQHAILRNFPIVGHFRYWLESIGPELRQYIVTGNDEERPFSRDQRRWVYASSKQQNNYFGFGTDNDLELSPNYLILKHATLVPHFESDGPYGKAPDWRVPCSKVLGGPRKRARAFRPDSIVNTSAMSYGSLSANAVHAINRGAKLAGCLQNTGEGGISDHHLHGGELIWQIGTGYFGCRDARGGFDLARFKDTLASAPVRAIELKLSQGAKPGHGGILPARKITPEIARIRGVPMGQDCISPPNHSTFSSPDELLDFVERLAEESGLPVGIKSAVGDDTFWRQLADLMDKGDRGVDFITIDGGEGGTGAAPLVYSDHVALPFLVGFARVYADFAERGLNGRVVFIGSGKLGFPERALLSMALGCDMVNVAREAMLSIGCIQALRCHTDHCPTGVATQNKWLVRGLDPTLKSVRLANYVVALRRTMLELAHTMGQPHPALVAPDQFEILGDDFSTRPAHEVFGYEAAWARRSVAEAETARGLMSGHVRPEPRSALPAVEVRVLS
ncbi:MAG TPA: FMN-binding glutamate synthase family protein [Planctomycetota bacterium]|nr:FMN-binding glutamate synthase family protein [Planctomycetota bacterium]